MQNEFNLPMRTWHNADYAVIKDYEKGLYYKNGKLVRTLGAGRHQFDRETFPEKFMKGMLRLATLGVAYMPPLDTEVTIVDTRQRALSIAGQEMLTLDKVPVRLNIVAQYRVKDAEKAVKASENFIEALYQDMQMSLRNYASSVTLDSLLVNKGEISKRLTADVAKKADTLGIELLSTGLKDVVLPGDIRELMTRVIAAEKEAKSKLILAREEAATARALANAAKIMSSDENILTLKKLELLREISKNPANKVYFGDAVSMEDAVPAKKKGRK
jgi:regulator of protease activity HflC (stomatin/prohibitin superfamily)